MEGTQFLLLVLAEFQALFEKLINGSTTADRKAAAQDVVEQMKAGGAASFVVSADLSFALSVWLMGSVLFLVSLLVY